jgi:hypothetical protein
MYISQQIALLINMKYLPTSPQIQCCNRTLSNIDKLTFITQFMLTFIDKHIFLFQICRYNDLLLLAYYR